MARPVLIPSPFVGPGSWRALADRLPDALIADYGDLEVAEPYREAAERVCAIADPEPWIAVLHSGAGGFAPALAAVAARLQGLVFLDAVLPFPGSSWLAAAPPALAARLRERTSADRLAPWNTWFEVDPAARLIPDGAARSAFVAGLPRAPWAFLEAVAPADDAWTRLPSAYVRLSGAYDREAAEAGRRGWTVRSADLHHLAMLSDPDRVAALLVGLPTPA